MKEKISVYLTISGQVQGVAFRYHARETARQMGLSGWIRNLDDGRVYACLQGPEQAIDKMTEWCRMGPEFARVTGVDVTPAPEEPSHRQFFVLI